LLLARKEVHKSSPFLEKIWPPLDLETKSGWKKIDLGLETFEDKQKGLKG
jgi:hypothetical protein